MPEKRVYECAVCHTAAPSGRCTWVRGVPVGPTCLKRLQRREYIRASGDNAKIVYNEETKLTHTVSDNSDVCPEREVHCLQCPLLTMKLCPIEEKYGHLYQNY